MKNEVIIKLLEELPDDLIDSAAEPPKTERRPLILRLVPFAAAACLIVVLSTVIYPMLRTEKPDLTENPVPAAETTAPSFGTPAPVTGTFPQEDDGSIVTDEDDPYLVHFVTEPVYHFTTAKRIKKTDSDPNADPEDQQPEEQSDPQDNQQQYNPQPAGDNSKGAEKTQASTRATAKSTAKSTAKTTAKTTAKPATKPPEPPQTVPAAPVTKPMDIDVPKPAEPTGVEDGNLSGESRIECRYGTTKSRARASDFSDKATDENGSPLIGGEDPQEEADAVLKGNYVTVTIPCPCSNAILTYCGLENDELRIEAFYDCKDPEHLNKITLRLTLPEKYADQIGSISCSAYEVDDIDEFDYEKGRVTLVIL